MRKMWGIVGVALMALMMTAGSCGDSSAPSAGGSGEALFGWQLGAPMPAGLNKVAVIDSTVTLNLTSEAKAKTFENGTSAMNGSWMAPLASFFHGGGLPSKSVSDVKPNIDINAGVAGGIDAKAESVAKFQEQYFFSYPDDGSVSSIVVSSSVSPSSSSVYQASNKDTIRRSLFGKSLSTDWMPFFMGRVDLSMPLLAPFLASLETALMDDSTLFSQFYLDAHYQPVIPVPGSFLWGMDNDYQLKGLLDFGNDGQGSHYAATTSGDYVLNWQWLNAENTTLKNYSLMTRDVKGRVVSIENGNGSKMEMTYSDANLLTKVTSTTLSASVSHAFSYDATNRLSQVSSTSGTTSYSQALTYNAQGLLSDTAVTSAQDPQTMTIHFGYDGARVASVAMTECEKPESCSQGLSTAIGYDAKGRLNRIENDSHITTAKFADDADLPVAPSLSAIDLFSLTTVDCVATPEHAACGQIVIPENQCGDGVCDAGESINECPADCVGAKPDEEVPDNGGGTGAACGNGTCDTGETTDTCKSDCPPVITDCGNGICNKFETTANCAADCPAVSPAVSPDPVIHVCTTDAQCNAPFKCEVSFGLCSAMVPTITVTEVTNAFRLAWKTHFWPDQSAVEKWRVFVDSGENTKMSGGYEDVTSPSYVYTYESKKPFQFKVCPMKNDRVFMVGCTSANAHQ